MDNKFPPQKILSTVYEFLSKHYPTSKIVGITGSYADHTYNKSSDIDLIIISDVLSMVKAETYYFYNILFDVYALPKSRIEDIINRDFFGGEGIIIDKLRKSLILRDVDNLFQELKTQCAFLYDTGPYPAKQKNILAYRSKIISLINDLKGNLDLDQNIFIVSQNLESIVHYFTMINCEWQVKGKHIPHFMRDKFPLFYNELSFSLNSFYKLGAKKELIYFLEKVVEYVPEMKQKQSNSSVFNDYGSNVFCVAFSGVFDYKAFITGYLQEIIMKTGMISPFFFKSENSALGQLILVVYNSNENRNIELANKLELIRQSHIKSNKQINMIFPFNLLNTNYYQYLFIDQMVLNHFSLLSELFVAKINQLPAWDQTTAFSIATDFVLLLSLENNISREHILLYSQYMEEDWMANILGGATRNIFQLEQQKKRLEVEMDKILVQKKQFVKKVRTSLYDRLTGDVEKNDKELSKWMFNLEKLFSNKHKTALNPILIMGSRSKQLSNSSKLEEFYSYKLIISYFCDLISLNTFNRIVLMKIIIKSFQD